MMALEAARAITTEAMTSAVQITEIQEDAVIQMKMIPATADEAATDGIHAISAEDTKETAETTATEEISGTTTEATKDAAQTTEIQEIQKDADLTDAAQTKGVPAATADEATTEANATVQTEIEMIIIEDFRAAMTIQMNTKEFSQNYRR